MGLDLSFFLESFPCEREEPERDEEDADEDAMDEEDAAVLLARLPDGWAFLRDDGGSEADEDAFDGAVVDVKSRGISPVGARPVGVDRTGRLTAPPPPGAGVSAPAAVPTPALAWLAVVPVKADHARGPPEGFPGEVVRPPPPVFGDSVEEVPVGPASDPWAFGRPAAEDPGGPLRGFGTSGSSDIARWGRFNKIPEKFCGAKNLLTYRNRKRKGNLYYYFNFKNLPYFQNSLQ